MLTRPFNTQILDRVKGEQNIIEYLSNRNEDEFCALCLIDIDDFRKINIEQGYDFGQQILEEFKKALIESSCENDFVISLGSDEFLLFATEANQKTVDKRVKSLYTKLAKLSRSRGVQIGCSTGLAGTDKAISFLDLYKCADVTLQHIKQYGKNNVAWYADASDDIKRALAGGVFKNEDETAAKEDIIAFAFGIFENTTDARKAFSTLLERIGLQYNLDSIKLVALNEDMRTINIFSHWVSAPEHEDKKPFKFMNDERMQSGFMKCFNAEGYFSDRDIILENIDPVGQKIFSTIYKKHYLVKGIFESGAYKGSVIFESDNEDFVFTDEIIATFLALAKILSINMLKYIATTANEAKSSFISKMSHDIRTPMNGIIGMTNIAMNVVDDKEKLIDCLKKINSSTQYLLSLVNDVLDISRIECGKVTINNEPVNLRDIGQYIENMIKVQAVDKDIDFKTEINISDEHVIADGVKINQVIMNLVGNAIKFTDKGGKVTFSMKQILQESDNIKVLFSVKDTGIGIDKKNLNKIFDAFEQEDSNIVNIYGGSGLGLAISSNLVRYMGGELKVESTKGEGSEFYFELPFMIDKNPGAEKEDTSKEEEKEIDYDFTGKRVLVVEDNELNAEIATEVLKRVGFEIDHAENGKKAVFKFAEMPAFHYDVILMDIRMPVMDGFEATKFIRGMGKKDSKLVPIVAMTANAFDEDMDKSLKNGMNGHLSKPIDVKKLYKMLNKQIFNPQSNDDEFEENWKQFEE